MREWRKAAADARAVGPSERGHFATSNGRQGSVTKQVPIGLAEQALTAPHALCEQPAMEALASERKPLRNKP